MKTEVEDIVDLVSSEDENEIIYQNVIKIEDNDRSTDGQSTKGLNEEEDDYNFIRILIQVMSSNKSQPMVEIWRRVSEFSSMNEIQCQIRFSKLFAKYQEVLNKSKTPFEAYDTFKGFDLFKGLDFKRLDCSKTSRRLIKVLSKKFETFDGNKSETNGGQTSTRSEDNGNISDNSGFESSDDLMYGNRRPIDAMSRDKVDDIFQEPSSVNINADPNYSLSEDNEVVPQIQETIESDYNEKNSEIETKRNDNNFNQTEAKSSSESMNDLRGNDDKSTDNEVLASSSGTNKTKTIFKCHWPKCEATFTLKIALNQHKLIHTNGRSFVCPVSECGKRFNSKRGLNQHKRIHSDEKPFKCDFEDCVKRFRRKNQLIDHKNRIHLHLKNHKCVHNNCDKSFVTSSELNRHIRDKHSN